jgi:phosphoglycolate phosphatase
VITAEDCAGRHGDGGHEHRGGDAWRGGKREQERRQTFGGAATNALLAELGAGTLPPEVIVGFVGEGAAVLVRRALERSGLDPDTPRALDRFLVHYDARLLDSTHPYPRMIETVGVLRTRYRLAVLTNKPERPTLQILRGLEMDGVFADVIGGDSAHGRKPDPAGLLALVARAGITPAETLLVGDSPVDLATARRAGTHICLARYGFGYRFDANGFRGDELFIDQPAELPVIIDEFAD